MGRSFVRPSRGRTVHGSRMIETHVELQQTGNRVERGGGGGVRPWANRSQLLYLARTHA